ncbi:hypothetical protein BAY61_32425 (plasmid) [Prauserella marina]|uniref:Uncharacterized protein n=1 Tax=Prauserella marina TaxID=530584 RepID=A0A222W1A6_9PSEU|nr:hypothetical protein [Prauserella marina]ASR39988.1 hypothetical protein BAY61_32425 [Prauserella marina]PWV71328.1 hypothetical protein DES30_11244 [Prauserella marina]SDD96451.1 hypothetical protein SAMN05421630_11568 [Prauserella marina]
MLALALLRRYRVLRGDGVPASVAYRAATAAPTLPPYRSGPDETITFELDDPDLAAFTITAHLEPGPMPDISWLGEFTNTWSPEAIENSRDRRFYRYFVPTCTVAERRADFSARGYARAEAQRIAEHEARRDLRLAREIEHRIVVVSVRKAGVLLGAAVLGTDLDPDGDPEEQIVAVIDYYGLIDDAVQEARTALPGLIAALAA